MQQQDGKIEMTNLLDNPMWSSLTTCHAHFACGDGLARRYPRTISVLAAVCEKTPAAFADLATLLAPDERVMLFSPGGIDLSDIAECLPPELQIVHQGWAWQMLYAAPQPPAPGMAEIVPLTAQDTEAMLALVELTKPGPFIAGTRELGAYLGIWHDGQLVAMAGERIHMTGYHEISAVCTHPDYRGRGYAAQLTGELVRRQLSEGDCPILNVVHGNERVLGLYERLGFAKRRQGPVVAVQRIG